MADFAPFYGPVNRRGHFTQIELIETTKPGDKWVSYRPTGRQRAYFFGVRIPMRVAWFILAPWMKVLSWAK